MRHNSEKEKRQRLNTSALYTWEPDGLNVKDEKRYRKDQDWFIIWLRLLYLCDIFSMDVANLPYSNNRFRNWINDLQFIYEAAKSGAQRAA